MAIKELRIILTVDNLDELIKFYRDVAGMETSKEWHEATGNGIILDAGRASLELIDKSHAARIDEIEVTWPNGKRQTFRSVAADRVLQIDEGASNVHLMRTAQNKQR